jgi:hypothetical protein
MVYYSFPPPGSSNRKTAKIVAIITAILAGLAAIIVPITTAYINKPPPVDNTVQVLTIMRDDLKRIDRNQEQLRDDMIEQRGWVKGLAENQNYEVKNPRDVPIPPEEPIEIVEPLRKRGKPVGKSVIKNPLPMPHALEKSGEIPLPIKSGR